MRKTCLNTVYELAQKDERIFFIGSDLSFETLKEFKENIPDRFFMEGVSEANVVGMAAGLALSGKIVYINTIATFFSRRAYEQIVLDLCLHNVNVRLLNNGGGLVYAPLGPTHLAIEDIGIMRTIPNMTIVAPADADEMKRLIIESVDYQGPIYIRFGKGYDPIVTTDDVPFKIGKAFGYRNGRDALILTTGITLQLGLEASDALKREGLNVSVLHVPTVKPLDAKTILDYVGKASVVVTVEEHTVIGGLGSAIAEVMAEANFGSSKKFRRIGIPDVFAKQYGSQKDLMESYGISTENIISTIKQLQKTTNKAHSEAR
ncbi:MAG: transketolase [Candidatus Omnitrophica bacterium]|nr:transketolase [Candidatus Omnitrophota bacterium]